MRFAVGTKNPSKLFSVRGAVEKLFPAAGAAPGALASCRVTVLVPASGDAAAVTKVIHEPAEGVEPVHEIIGVEVASEVNAQPLSAWETLTGAQNRARNVAAALPDCDFHIGIEGGIETLVNPADPAQKRYFESGYIYVVRASDGKDSVGTSARFEMAPHVMARLHAGDELCEVMDDLAGIADVRSTQGMMGLITNGVLARGPCYEHGVTFAFAPFVSPKQYWDADAADAVSVSGRKHQFAAETESAANSSN